VTQPIAERVGRLAGERDSVGRNLPFGDGLIAATAIEHGLTLVTRNVRDFADLGLTVINPWDGRSLRSSGENHILEAAKS